MVKRKSAEVFITVGTPVAVVDGACTSNLYKNNEIYWR